MDPIKYKVAVTDSQLGQQVGNSMNVNVVERILINALVSAGLAKAEDLPDGWNLLRLLLICNRQLTNPLASQPGRRQFLIQNRANACILSLGRDTTHEDPSSIVELRFS